MRCKTPIQIWANFDLMASIHAQCQRLWVPEEVLYHFTSNRRDISASSHTTRSGGHSTGSFWHKSFKARELQPMMVPQVVYLRSPLAPNYLRAMAQRFGLLNSARTESISRSQARTRSSEYLQSSLHRKRDRPKRRMMSSLALAVGRSFRHLCF